MFLSCHVVGIAPGEFWDMTMGETILILNSHRDKQPGDHAGNLTNGDVDYLRDWMARGYPAEG